MRNNVGSTVRRSILPRGTVQRIRPPSLAATHRLRCFRFSQNAVVSRWTRWKTKLIGFAGPRIWRNDLRRLPLVSYPLILILVMTGPHAPDKSMILRFCSLLLTPTSRIHPFHQNLPQAPPSAIWSNTFLLSTTHLERQRHSHRVNLIESHPSIFLCPQRKTHWA